MYPIIYSLYIDSDNAVNVFLDDEKYDDFYEHNFTGEKLPSNWLAPPHKISGLRKPHKDFISGTLMAPFISEKAHTVMTPLIAPYIQIFPIITICKIQYYVINVTTVVDCVDLVNSDVAYSSEDPKRVVDIYNYKFLPKKIMDVPIFKVPDDRGANIFVMQSFVDIVLDNKLTGVGFEDPAKIGLAKKNPAVPGLPL